MTTDRWFEPEDEDISDRDDDTIGDHLLADGERALIRPPLLVIGPWCTFIGEWTRTDRTDIDRRARLESNRRETFGSVTCLTSPQGLLNRMEYIKTDPSHPCWRCHRWMTEIEGFAMDAVVASFSVNLGISGMPTVFIGTNGVVTLVWIVGNGGVTVELWGQPPAQPCGTCIGCRALSRNVDFADVCRVYFIQASEGGPVKIGRSADPKDRLSALQTGHPSTLRILATMRGGAKAEKALHAAFVNDRIRRKGEWFRPSQYLLDFIKEIGGAA